MPRSGGFARRSTSLACRRSSWPRSTGGARPGKSSTTPGRERALSRRARLRHEEALEWYGGVRYLRRARNACHLQFIAMAMNMKRALVLMRAT
jgi:hypothetical protein